MNNSDAREEFLLTLRFDCEQYVVQHMDALVITRFWSKVERGEGCWLWTGTMDSGGYGSFWWAPRSERAHRVAWMLTNGAIPDGKIICHTCDNPPCVNPAHLYAGTHTDNSRDCLERGRHVSGFRTFAGEGNPKAKLTHGQVEKIRLASEVGVPRTVLADAFGVHRTTISRIVHLNLWTKENA